MERKRGGEHVKITIKGSAEEIAALVVAIQEQHESLAQVVTQHLQDQTGSTQPFQ